MYLAERDQSDSGNVWRDCGGLRFRKKHEVVSDQNDLGVVCGETGAVRRVSDCVLQVASVRYNL